MTYILSNMIRDAMRFQGIDAFDIRTATGGSVTTFVDTTLADKYGDDELMDGFVLVLRTTDMIAPLGEFARISAYVEATQTATIATLSAAIDSGDKIMICPSDYPLNVMIELANDALRDAGEISVVSTVTDAIADAREYTLPVAYKNLVSVDYQGVNDDTDDNSWVPVSGYEVVPSAGGADALIILPYAIEVDYHIRFKYNSFHPEVSLCSDPINESITPPLGALTLADKIMQWHGVTNENSNYANKILSELNDAKRDYPVRRLKRKPQFFTFSKSS
jgi:hypothetical protein